MNKTNPGNRGRGAAGVARAFARQHITILWAAAFLIAITVFGWRQRGEVASVASAISAAEPHWLVVLVAVQLSILLFAAYSYRYVLRRLGHDVPVRSCASIHLQRHVIGAITPVGGPASVYVLVRALGRRGVCTNDALLTTTMRSAAGYVAFVLFLIPALIVQRPTPLIVGAVSALAALLLAMLATLSFVFRQRDSSSGITARLPGFARSFVDNAGTHHVGLRDLAAPLLFTALQNVAGVASVYVALLALGVDKAFAIALVGYAVGNLFATIAPVYQGMGVVELSMAVALHQQGLPMTTAVGATFLYRLGDVWLPLILGSGTYAAASESVRRTARSIAPSLAAGAVSVVLVAVARYGGITPLLGAENLSLSQPTITAIIAAVAGAWMIAMSSATLRNRLSGQLMPVTTFAVGTPVFALIMTVVDGTSPF